MKNLLFSFNDLSSSGRVEKKLKTYFGNAGANAISIDVDSKIKRTAGFKNRQISLTFADSQTVAMQIKESGDVFQVKLNGRVIPIKSQDDHKAAIAEITAKMDAGRTAFQKKLAKAKAPKPKGVKVSRKKRLDVVTEKRDGLKEAIADVRQQIADVRASAA